jgi:GR25 family glycosyltransferase involved in LPS biosynthesis
MDAVRANPLVMTIGMIGCALSHLKAYRKMLETDENLALIIEDDVILPKNIHFMLRQIAAEIKKGEVIMLYYTRLPGETPVLTKSSAVALDEKTELLYPISIPLSTAGYVIEREAARRLAETIMPIRVGADDWEYFLKNGTVDSLRCVYPRPFELTQAETQVQICHYEGISFKHRVWRYVSDNQTPLLYPLACRYLRFKEKNAPIELVEQPSIVLKANASEMSEPAFQKHR